WNTEWVIKKPVRCELHPLKKHFDRHSFFMTIKAKTVDSCVIFIPTDGFLRCLQIARSQRLERAFWKDNPFTCEVAKQRFRNVDAHLQKSGIRIVGRK